MRFFSRGEDLRHGRRVGILHGAVLKKVFCLVAAVLLAFGATALAQLSQDSFSSNDPFAQRFKEKSKVELKLKPIKPGGPVKITAAQENCEQDFNVCTAKGDVRVEYQDVTIRAQTLTLDRKSTRLNSSHERLSRMPSSA